VAIKQAFDREGITIPYPTQMTVLPDEPGSRRGPGAGAERAPESR
jgi:small-conductance mechanosensitive channel